MKNKYYYTVLPYSYYRKNRKYANGSFMAAQDRAMKENFSNGAGFSSVMGMLGGASDILKTSVDLAKIADTSETENAMENMGTDVNASSLDSLMEQWGTSANTGNSYTWRDVRGKSDGEIAGGILGAGLSGATAGAAAGPIGAIVGGAVGLIGSGIGAAVGRSKAERKAGQLNDMANEANLRQQLAFASNADSIMDQQNLAAMSTLAAHGGRIYIKPSKRGTFTAAAKRRGLGVQEFASKVLANKDRYSSAMVKKANFARNFGGHRKDEGGENNTVTTNDIVNALHLTDEFYDLWETMGRDSVLNRQRRNAEAMRKYLKDTQGAEIHISDTSFDRMPVLSVRDTETNADLGMKLQDSYAGVFRGSENISQEYGVPPQVIIGSQESPRFVEDGLNGNIIELGPVDVVAHERAHATGSTFSTPFSNKLLHKLLLSPYNGYDETPEERGANLMGLRALMYKEGIKEAAEGGEITMEQLKEMKKKYPKLRIFQFNEGNEEDLLKALNLIAQNNTSGTGSDTSHIARYGGHLKAGGGNKQTAKNILKQQVSILTGESTPSEADAYNTLMSKVASERESYTSPIYENLYPQELADSIISPTSRYVDGRRAHKYRTAIRKADSYMDLRNKGVYNIDNDNHPLFEGFDSKLAREIDSYLDKYNFTDAQRAAFMANLWRENRFRNNHRDTQIGAVHGMFQFNDSKGEGGSDTYTRYLNWLKKNNKKDTRKSQIEFFVEEYMPGRPNYKSIWMNPDATVDELSDYLIRDVYSPSQREDPNYYPRYRNASRALMYKRALGGPVTHGGEFSNGITQINNGGLHEQNPMEGVPMGIAPDGLPNLVEEGEVIFNDYVFSNRLEPDKKDLEKMNLKKYKNRTFAQIAKSLQKESEERPNDPISKNGLEDSMAKLTALQEKVRNNTGKSNTGRTMQSGGPLGEDLPDYWVSSKYFEEPHIYGAALPDSTQKTAGPSTESSFSPDPNMSFIQSRFFPKFPFQSMSYAQSAGKPPKQSNEKEDSSESPSASLPTGLRYAPVVGSLIGSIASAFARPDYEHSNSLLEAASRQRPSRVRFRPVGNYMRYTPLNTSYMMNRLNAETAGTRRALENMSGGNAAAARNQLTALNRSSQDALGDAFIKAEQYNDNLKRQVEEFNRGTNMFNSQGAMQADSVNAQMQNAYDARRLAAIDQAMRMREASDAALEQSRALNFTNLFDNLGDIGRENFSFNQTRIPGLRYGYTDKDGNTVWLNSYGGMLTKRTGKRRRR